VAISRPKHNKIVTNKLNRMKKLLYLLLKKDMIKKLSKKHGTQFVDDVMAIFGIPTDTTNEYLKTLKQAEK
jgi:hypothetical protein